MFSELSAGATTTLVGGHLRNGGLSMRAKCGMHTARRQHQHSVARHNDVVSKIFSQRTPSFPGLVVLQKSLHTTLPRAAAAHFWQALMYVCTTCFTEPSSLNRCRLYVPQLNQENVLTMSRPSGVVFAVTISRGCSRKLLRPFGSSGVGRPAWACSEYTSRRVSMAQLSMSTFVHDGSLDVGEVFQEDTVASSFAWKLVVPASLLFAKVI